MDIPDKKTKVLIATFSPWKQGKRLPINGNVEPLRDFLVPKTAKTVIIDQQYPGSDAVIPRVEVYQRDKNRTVYASIRWLFFLYPLLKMTNTSGTRIMFKIRDFLSVVIWCMRQREHYDYFIGLECVNALAGIVMKKSGFIKTVIYYVSDFSPHRYTSKHFNAFYLWLDRYCAMHADFIWDVSRAMQPARISSGLNPNKSAPVIHVPNALYPSQIGNNPIRAVDAHSLVFMGTLGLDNGPDIAIEALATVLRTFPDTRLHIIGGTAAEIAALKKQARELKLDGSVTFHGFIADRNRISAMLRNYVIALAPYRAIVGSPRSYGDATKIRAYVAAGLPVITTEVPPLGRELALAGGAIIAKDNPKSLASAILTVYSNRNIYLSLRKNSYKFARGNTWENVYHNAFRQMKERNAYG